MNFISFTLASFGYTLKLFLIFIYKINLKKSYKLFLIFHILPSNLRHIEEYLFQQEANNFTIFY